LGCSGWVRCFCRELRAKHSIRVPADYSQPACGVRCSAKPGAASQLPVFGVLFKKKNVFGIVFTAFLCISQKKKGFRKRHKNLFEKNACQQTFYKKVEGENTFFAVIFPHRFVFVAFLAVSLHEELKDTTQKIKPENRKNRKKM
jgi:hypothetical protein